MGELKEGVARYIHFYNVELFHESLGYETPDERYGGKFSVGDIIEVA